MRYQKVVILGLFSLLASVGTAGATTYYVDAVRGNDGWSGRLPDPAVATAADGPWQSLSRASQVVLAAGDVLALRCGSLWSETLKVTNSGTAEQPITIRPYPAPCVGAGPAIDGFTRISGARWTRISANLYSLRFPLNLLSDSRFDRGVGAWRIWSPAGDALLSTAGNCGADGLACLQITSGTGAQPTVAYGATFRLAAGAAYRMRFDVKAAPGTRLRAYVRRAQAPFDVVGVSTEVIGNGAWQTVALPFVGHAQIENARLDFDLPSGNARASINNVSVEQQLLVPFAAMLGSTPLIIAHHPNRGHNALEPNSPFLRNAADANIVVTGAGASGSSYVVLGRDYAPPPGTHLQPGTTIRIRTKAWLIDERTVVAVSGNRVMLDRPTSYPLNAGWGYYLSGQAWMLDEAGEWWFDSVNSTLQIRTSTDSPPILPLALSTLDTCIDLSGTRFVTLDAVSATGCRTGVNVAGARSVILRSMKLTDIAANGVFAPASNGVQVLGSRIERTGQHAILGKDGSPSIALAMLVNGNTIIDTGVTRIGDKLVTLPLPTLAAVMPGAAATVSNNFISGAGYNGIRTFGDGNVSRNLIERACLVLDDGAGIYAFGAGASGRIEANIVRDIPGALDGKPVGSTSQGQGILLDDHVTGTKVVGNTVSNAESGVLLHNAHLNTVQGNVLYGNRRHQLWLFEDSRVKRADGDVYGNLVSDNVLFSTSPVAALGQQSVIKDTARFASFDRNRYSALISGRVVSEDWPTGSSALDFQSWQRALTTSGAWRSLEPNGSVVNSDGYASFRVLGANIVQNGDMTVGVAGWTPWSKSPPLATVRTVVCENQKCLEVTGGGTSSLVASPPFSVVAGNWYRASFDLKSAVAQSIAVLVRRGGGGTNGFESLMGSAEMLNAQTAFKRFSFNFKAEKSVVAADPVTRDIGARLDFERIAPGNQVLLANVEVVPLSGVNATLQTRLFSNPSGGPVAMVCPDLADNPSRCAHYINFATGAPIYWPLLLAAHTSAVGFTKDNSLTDGDGDGISDAQDQCPSTVAGAVTNSKGCAL